MGLIVVGLIAGSVWSISTFIAPIRPIWSSSYRVVTEMGAIWGGTGLVCLTCMGSVESRGFRLGLSMQSGDKEGCWSESGLGNEGVGWCREDGRESGKGEKEVRGSWEGGEGFGSGEREGICGRFWV